MDVIALLQAKNRRLERFRDLSMEFAASAETGDLSRLEDFERRRDKTFRAIEFFDVKISEVIAGLASEQRTSRLIEQVRQEMTKNEGLVREILLADQRVIVSIETEKLRITQEVNSSRKHREVVSKFKSTWVTESGEELDQKL